MTYDIAVAKAWLELEEVADKKRESVRFLNDEYSVDLEEKRILSLSCNIPAQDHVSVLILHYLARRYKGIPAVSGEWISFKQLIGGEGYYPIFKKRAIGPLLRKHGAKPESLLDAAESFRAKKAQLGDISIVIEVFDGVPLLITMQRGDEEFGPEANILFDKSITDIFCTEDIVVLSEHAAAHI